MRLTISAQKGRDMKARQRGFSAVEGLLILVILGIVGFTSWYVFHSNNNANQAYNNAATSGNSQTAASNLSGGAQNQSGATGCSLAMAVGQKDGAAGTFHENLIFTNQGTGDCVLNGYPTVTLLDSAGKQIGQAAGQDTSVSVVVVTLKPNQSASATLSLPDPDIAGNCSAMAVAEIQATLPGISGTLKTADTTDHYCPNFMTRPIQPSH